MGLKHHTILLVPHARARFRKWRVTNRQIAITATVAVALVVGALFTTWSFLTNEVDRAQLEQTRRENEALREVNRGFEESIRTLETQLQEFEQQTRDLAIVAGIDSESATALDPGVGGEAMTRDQIDPEALSSLDDRATSLGQRLADVDRLFDERVQWISSTPAISPVKGVLTSGYGYRRDPMTGQRAAHWAIDIATAPGQPVRASADGIVVRAGRVGGLGNAVYLSHGYGITTRYGHLSELSVRPGERIQRGDSIGLVGSTGRSTGHHLHYEVRVDSKPVNPLGYILDGTSPGY